MVQTFQGEYLHKFDDKGRIIVPQIFREKLGLEFQVSVDVDDGCLTIYTLDEWDKVHEEINSKPRFDKETKTMKRRFYANSEKCNLDKQGRIRIPDHLREKAKLMGKEVYFIGAGEIAELWDKDEWESIR
ncbi:MAG TPA: division/cell wall cluster transcriptional repressor MraZ [Clostridia bacterium]|jgi:MraZ protein|nr:division/cell wall cluster transcriptional repressor MraZ [Clostridia bacterium]HPQ45781.1 division/cell wall cluster transcriptional repressor MraZ [Clostridia bacterium]HRX42070.1 division/cell wall cluster transcriptional repressor MraZ [Clostridia bacterium]